MQIVIQHGDRRAGADLLVHAGKKVTAIAPGAALAVELEAGQSLKLSIRTAAAPAADEGATNGEGTTE